MLSEFSPEEFAAQMEQSLMSTVKRYLQGRHDMTTGTESEVPLNAPKISD